MLRVKPPMLVRRVANMIRECDGKVDYMSFWTFSEVFEEGGPPRRPSSTLACGR